MMMKHETYPAALLQLVATAGESARMIPPLFPLDSSVAVNPFLGQSTETLPQAAARMARVAGIGVTQTRATLLARVDTGEISDADLGEALERSGTDMPLDAFKAAMRSPAAPCTALPTVAELAAEASGIDWPAIVADRIGTWAAGHFDRGQALWQSPQDGAYAAWRAYAARDLTPEIMGLTGFAALVESAPRSAWRAMGQAAEILGIEADAAPTAFHRLLVDMGGWAQYARYELWQAELAGDSVDTVTDMLTIRMIWDAALLRQYADSIGARWKQTVAAHAEPLVPGTDHIIDAVLQEAAERAAQRGMADSFAAVDSAARTGRPAMQAAFCIDVRSEVFRRALESLDAGIETIGFAGFFGLAVAHKSAASDVVEARGPVLLNMGVQTRSALPDPVDEATRFSARARRAWGRFKLAAVSSFAFVEAMGPVYAGKLVRDGLGLEAGKQDFGPVPQAEGLDLAARIGAAETILKAMSLTEGFARVVLLAGHGSHVTNNAHASALQCGACGGHAGDVNARLLAGLLNAADVRSGLLERGIEIPSDTVFVGALHDTATDGVTLFDGDTPAPAHGADMAQVRSWLDQAGRLARAERAPVLPRAASDADVLKRSLDWAELRPEWGLAGCKAFIAAPRGRTATLDLGGRSFLHSYDWTADKGFGVLELILTAPVVVASWISLQYYGSVVAPQMFGGGNKLLHNVTGGIGVVEGNGGTLRAGLPWQSVHDGTRFMHDPLRLSVIVEAPRSAMNDILARHAGVKALFDNGWLHLFEMDGDGRMAWRYTGDLNWEPVGNQPHTPACLAAE